MRNLANALRRVGADASIPVPWGTLRGLEPLRGNLAIVLGDPGTGKSAFALNWALGIKEPSLLLSLDTDLGTQAIRTCAILSGRPASRIKSDPALWANYLERQSLVMRPYDLNLDTRELGSLLAAETEFWGTPPALTIVDNVSNMLRDGGYEEYRKIFVDLHRIARTHDTFILALHHTKRHSDQMSAPTLSSGQFAGEQEAEMVLGLWAKDFNADDNESVLRVSILKNRNGKADPSGGLWLPLYFERDKMIVRDLSPTETALQVLRRQL